MPIARVDLTSAPIARVPIARVPIARVAFEALPIARVPLVDQLSLLPPSGQGIPALPASLLGRRLVDAAPGTISAIVDCTVVACQSTTATLGTAFAARDSRGVPNGILATATIAALVDAYSTLTLGDIAPWSKLDGTTTFGQLADFGDLTVEELLAGLGSPDVDEITLGEVLNGFVAREDVAWDGLDLASPDLAAAGSSGDDVTYTVVTSTTGPSTSPDVLHIALPSGWTLADGGVVVDGSVVPAERLSTSGTNTDVSLDAVATGSIVRVTAHPGLATGDQQAEFTVRPATQPVVSAPESDAHTTVTESFEPNDTVAQAPTAVGGLGIDSGTLYVSTIDSATDVDLWPVLVPRGSELSVALSGMDADYDLVVYSPPGAQEDPLIDLDGGLRGTPQGSLPYLPDFGLGLGRNDTRVQPTMLQDVPLQTDRRVYAASLQRGTTAERIDTPALGGGIYFIQVTGFNGAHSTKPYGLRASVRPSVASPTCSTTGPTHVAQTAPAFPAAATSGATTLFVLNSARFTDTWTPAVAAPTYAELAATVTAINANPAAFGGGTAAVLDLSTKPDVVNAYTQWDAGRCEPQRANAVVKAIGGAIDQFAAEQRPAVRQRRADRRRRHHPDGARRRRHDARQRARVRTHVQHEQRAGLVAVLRHRADRRPLRRRPPGEDRCG